jgi:hypothetical protein
MMHCVRCGIELSLAWPLIDGPPTIYICNPCVEPLAQRLHDIRYGATVLITVSPETMKEIMR